VICALFLHLDRDSLISVSGVPGFLEIGAGDPAGGSRMAALRHAQRGITLTGVLIGAALIAFFVYSGAKLTPVYLENFSVKSSLKSLASDDAKPGNAREIRDQLMRRLQINNVQNVKPEHITVRVEGNRRIVTVDYEVRTRFYGNLWLLASFSEKAEFTG
jgi:hypothetical protein